MVSTLGRKPATAPDPEHEDMSEPLLHVFTRACVRAPTRTAA